MVIAIASDPAAMKQALNKRAHFTLQKPFIPELMTNTLKAGYSLIVDVELAPRRPGQPDVNAVAFQFGSSRSFIKVFLTQAG